jgi:hypothetical protein
MEDLEGADCDKCPRTQYNDCAPKKIAQTFEAHDCVDPKPQEAIKIVDVIIALARLADVLQGAFMLHIGGGKAASMLPDLKKNGIIEHQNYHFKQEIVAHVSLRSHQPPCLRCKNTFASSAFT